MYVPAHFAEDRPEVLHGLMRARPLAALIAIGPGGIVANHVPLQLELGPLGLGVLRGHLARANPMWQEYDRSQDVLALFQGSDSYISPSWYPTKQEHGKVVPTWNYCTVHAHGPMRVHEDAPWLRALVGSLTDWQEAGLPHPWAVQDAPEDYVRSLLAQIVGIEIEIRRLTGKWKLSQNQPARNRAGVVQALAARESADAQAMAQLIRAHEPKPGN